MTTMLAGVVLAICAGPAAAREPLRLLSYNIRHGEGTDGKTDLARLARVIVDAGAQIVALQEVDRETERSKCVDIARELARMTGMRAVFGASIPYQGGEYGNAFLIGSGIRFDRADTEVHRLPSPQESEPRSVLEMPLELPGGLRLTVLATHWCHREEENRLASAGFIDKLVGGRDSVFLMGDLNATPDSAPLRRLVEAGWRRPGDRPLPTIPAGKPQRQIDFILFRPAQRWRVESVEVIAEETASDHRPLLLVVSPD